MSKYTPEQLELEARQMLAMGLFGIHQMLRAYAEELRKREEVVLETVGFVRQTEPGELRIDWVLEGGIDALEPGCELLVSSSKITDDEGSGILYAYGATKENNDGH